MIKITARTTMAAALSCALFLPVLTTGPALAGFEWTPPPRAIPRPAAPLPVDDIPPAAAAPAVPVDSAPLPAVADEIAAEAAAQAAMNEGAALDGATPPADPWAEETPAVPVLSDDPLGRIAAPGTPVPRGPHDEPLIMPRHGSMQMPAPMPAPVVMPAPVPVAAMPAAVPAPFMKAAPVVVPVAAPVAALPAMAMAEGFGRDIPLALALPQIVPAGYSFVFASGVNAGVRVSWDGGRPWNHVLTDALAVHGMSAAIAGNTVAVHNGMAPVVAVAPAPYLPAPVPVTAMPMPAPAAPGVSAQPASNGGGWRAVNDWHAEDGYKPSYPRRDPANARDRMMQDAAIAVQRQEPSGNNPDAASRPVTLGYEPAYNAAPMGAPMPLLAPEAPVAAAEAKTYTQLTGLGDQAMRPMDPQEIRYWQAQPGESLRTVLTNWSEQAGVQLFWAEGVDYQISAPIQMHGTFPVAIGKILEGYNGGSPQPMGQLHANQPDGAAVLIIDHRV